MKKLFWGVFFVYLNFNLNLGGHQLNLLPDFVGYTLLLLGAKELAGKSACFQRARPFAAVMAVYSAVVWCGSLFAVALGGWFSLLLPIVAVAVSLYIARLMVDGVREMERNEEQTWGGFILIKRWKLLVGAHAASYLLSLAAKLQGSEQLYALAAAVSIVNMICILMYLLAWYRTWNAYEASGKEKREETEETGETEEQ